MLVTCVSSQTMRLIQQTETQKTTHQSQNKNEWTQRKILLRQHACSRARKLLFLVFCDWKGDDLLHFLVCFLLTGMLLTTDCFFHFFLFFIFFLQDSLLFGKQWKSGTICRLLILQTSQFRAVTAWFCVTAPMRGKPWELNGLPDDQRSKKWPLHKIPSSWLQN